MLYTLLLIYLAVALPLSVLIWAALVAAKWGSAPKDKPYSRTLRSYVIKKFL